MIYRPLQVSSRLRERVVAPVVAVPLEGVFFFSVNVSGGRVPAYRNSTFLLALLTPLQLETRFGGQHYLGLV